MVKSEISARAKSLGAKNLKVVADHYKCTPKHLRDFYHRNIDGFDAMVIGYVKFNESKGEG